MCTSIYDNDVLKHPKVNADGIEYLEFLKIEFANLKQWFSALGTTSDRITEVLSTISIDIMCDALIDVINDDKCGNNAGATISLNN